MNYLAHSFLTFTDAQIVGQFLEDHIKNKQRYTFPIDIQEGITLHRAIDTFTDSHPAIHEAKKVFSPLVRLYSGAFVDVCMDYFLANDKKLLTPTLWKKHSARVYKVLNENVHYFPEYFKNMLFRMEQDDWLYNYREDQGIEFSIRNVLNKAQYLEKNIPVFETFLKEKNYLESCYNLFFGDLSAHVLSIHQTFRISDRDND